VLDFHFTPQFLYSPSSVFHLSIPLPFLLTPILVILFSFYLQSLLFHFGRLNIFLLLFLFFCIVLIFSSLYSFSSLVHILLLPHTFLYSLLLYFFCSSFHVLSLLIFRIHYILFLIFLFSFSFLFYCYYILVLIHLLR
jgi:hypothetical protein